MHNSVYKFYILVVSRSSFIYLSKASVIESEEKIALRHSIQHKTVILIIDFSNNTMIPRIYSFDARIIIVRITSSLSDKVNSE